MKPYFRRQEDGSIDIEWVGNNHRFGITIGANKNLKDCGWFFVSRNMEDNDYGDLPPEFLEMINMTEKKEE